MKLTSELTVLSSQHGLTSTGIPLRVQMRSPSRPRRSLQFT